MRFLILLLFPFTLPAVNDDGVVVVLFGDNRIFDREVLLYNSPTDSLPVMKCKGYDQFHDSISPFFDYASPPNPVYRCAGESASRLAIRDEKYPTKIFWIKKDSLTYFENWKGWFTSFGDVTISIDTLYASPGKNPHRLKFPGDCECNIFSIDSISGDWMRVFDTGCWMENYEKRCASKTKFRPGWVKWREGENIYAYPYLAE